MTLMAHISSGVGTKIDPTLCRADRMVGQVLGAVGSLPDIFTEIEISFFLLRRLLGVRTEGDKKGAKVSSKSISHYYDTLQDSFSDLRTVFCLDFSYTHISTSSLRRTKTFINVHRLVPLYKIKLKKGTNTGEVYLAHFFHRNLK